MNIENFTHSSQDLINNSVTLAMQRKNPTLQPLHVLSASLNNEFCKSFYTVLNVDTGQLTRLVNQELDKLPIVQGGQLTVDPSLESFITICKQEAEKLKDAYVSLEHFLLAFSETTYLPTSIRDFFKNSTFKRTNILAHMSTLRKGKTIQEKNAENHYQILERYCKNITQEAREGKLDPVIGRT